MSMVNSQAAALKPSQLLPYCLHVFLRNSHTQREKAVINEKILQQFSLWTNYIM